MMSNYVLGRLRHCICKRLLFMLYKNKVSQKNLCNMDILGSGCDSVGRPVASIPEVRGSNPVISKLYIECLLSTVLKTGK